MQELKNTLTQIFQLIKSIESAIIDGGIQKDIDRLIDDWKTKYMTTQYSFWSFIVVFNSVVIGALPILTAIGKSKSNLLTITLFTICSIIIFMIFNNLRRIKRSYKEMWLFYENIRFEKDINKIKELSIQKANKYADIRDKIEKKENIIYYLCIVEFVIFVSFMFAYMYPEYLNKIKLIIHALTSRCS